MTLILTGMVIYFCTGDWIYLNLLEELVYVMLEKGYPLKKIYLKKLSPLIFNEIWKRKLIQLIFNILEYMVG